MTSKLEEAQRHIDRVELELEGYKRSTNEHKTKIADMEKAIQHYESEREQFIRQLEAASTLRQPRLVGLENLPQSVKQASVQAEAAAKEAMESHIAAVRETVEWFIAALDQTDAPQKIPAELSKNLSPKLRKSIDALWGQVHSLRQESDSLRSQRDKAVQSRALVVGENAALKASLAMQADSDATIAGLHHQVAELRGHLETADAELKATTSHYEVHLAALAASQGIAPPNAADTRRIRQRPSIGWPLLGVVAALAILTAIVAATWSQLSPEALEPVGAVATATTVGLVASTSAPNRQSAASQPGTAIATPTVSAVITAIIAATRTPKRAVPTPTTMKVAPTITPAATSTALTSIPDEVASSEPSTTAIIAAPLLTVDAGESSFADEWAQVADVRLAIESMAFRAAVIGERARGVGEVRGTTGAWDDLLIVVAADAGEFEVRLKQPVHFLRADTVGVGTQVRFIGTVSSISGIDARRIELVDATVHEVPGVVAE